METARPRPVPLPGVAGHHHRRCCRPRFIAKLCRMVISLALAMTVVINLIFIVDTKYKLNKPAVYVEEDQTSTTSMDQPARSLTLDVLSSQHRVSVSVDGAVILDDAEEGKGRGMHVVVLHDGTGAVMAHRLFDTYTAHEDEALNLFLNLVTAGRILIIAIKDEATFHLRSDARNLLQRLGSVESQILSWRDMWVLVVSHKEGRSWCEQRSASHSFNEWAKPVAMTCQVPLSSVPNSDVLCHQWEATEDNRRRRDFCSKVEGYGSVCDCQEPAPITFRPPAIPDGQRLLDVPVAVIASNRPHYLYRMLRSLLTARGANASMVTVFVDGFYEETMDVVELFGLKGVRHRPLGTKNTRITQHYKFSLKSLFEQHPNAGAAIVVEEDLDVSPDFFSYFGQLRHLLDEDPTLYCISAWNDHGYQHSSSDATLLYRVETMPGLGWMLTSRLFREELEPSWPSQDQMWDWDLWMRKPRVRRKRECIIPDVPRTYHFGATGLNMNSYFQDTYFRKRALNNIPDVRLNHVDDLFAENYERVVHSIIANATLLDHSVSPCLDIFVPDVEGKTFVLFIKMRSSRDTTTWLQVAKCFKIWDLDARGSHKGLWRFHHNSNPILVIGSPYSVYSKYKPPELIPMLLEPPPPTTTSMKPGS